MAENVVIIGSGPAGFTAGIYAARANLSPLLFEGFQKGGMPGGQLMTTGVIENFPGFPNGIDGQQLMQQMRQQCTNFGTRTVMEDIVDVDLDTHPFVLTTSEEKKYETNTIIVSTGANARRLDLDSEKRLWGRGISACAVCDGGLPMFRNKELAVIGGGDSAIEEASHLAHFGSKVYIIHRRDELRAGKILQKRAFENPRIEVLWNKVVEEFLGEQTLTGITLRDTVSGETSRLPVAGAFEAIGHTPNTDFLKGQIETDDMGYIKVRAGTSATSTPGVFASGDVQDSRYRQAITAAGSGCKAAIDAERWLQERGLAL